MYSRHATITKLAHAHGFRIGGDYALYMFGIKKKYLPRMHVMYVYGSALESDKLIRTLDVMFGVTVVHKDFKTFVFKTEIRIGAMTLFFATLHDDFIFSKDIILIGPRGIEVESTSNNTFVGSRSMECFEKTKKLRMTLLCTSLVASRDSSDAWETVEDHVDYIRCGWKIDGESMWNLHVVSHAPNVYECSICQMAKEGDIFIQTMCAHQFHLTCLKQWVHSNEKDSCPLCRSSHLICHKDC